MLFHTRWYLLLACLIILFLPLFFKALGSFPWQCVSRLQLQSLWTATDVCMCVYVCAGGRELSVDLYAVLCNRQAGLWRISFHAVSMSAHMAKCVCPCTTKNPHSRLDAPRYRFMQPPGISEILCVSCSVIFESFSPRICMYCMKKNTFLRAYFRHFF